MWTGLPAAQAELAQPDKLAVLRHYARMAHAVYGDSLAGAQALQQAVSTFLADPRDETMEAARRAWIAARVPYLQSEAFRFTNPIVDEWEGRVNSWPLDEGLIDYVEARDHETDNPLFSANIIANTRVMIDGREVDTSTITPELLRDVLHEAGGLRANVATGYHAIEFLLWGQDLNGTGPGAGNRPATDYDPRACTHGHCERRAAYLRVATQLLVDDLDWIVKQWEPAGDAYQAITTRAPEEAFVLMFSGIASLSYGELAGERMKLALLLHDPEEEHDCFSDNSHNSHYWDVIGIRNVYLGQYKRTGGSVISGPSLSDVVRARSAATDDEVRAALDHTVSRMDVLVDSAKGGVPFDMLVAEGNVAGNRIVQSAVDALLAQTTSLRRAVAALDLKGLKVIDAESLRNPDSVRR